MRSEAIVKWALSRPHRDLTAAAILNDFVRAHFKPLRYISGDMKVSGSTTGAASGAKGVQAYSSVQRVSGVKQSAPVRRSDDVSSVLGIPEAEFTPTVREAIMTLMSEVDRLRQDLDRTKERLESVQMMADQDGLLPVLNRRAFIRELSRILSFGERYDLSASLIYFDLNGFKAINDTLGHAAGDAVLQHVSSVLLANVRESDVLGRLGGDEFGLILAKADDAQAAKKAASLGALIQSSPAVWQGAAVEISVSYGVHAFSKGEAPDKAIAAADQAMYEAKRARRS